MRKNTLLFLSFFTLSIVSAQTLEFELADPQPDIIDVYGGSFASGDIDNDGDQDLLITGLDPGRETALYLNDGNGDFTEIVNIPFPEASSSVTIFEDFDLDGDLDLFFSGRGFNVGDFTHIYLNDGQGVFTQLANPLLPQFSDSGVGVEDIDNDGDMDVLLTILDENNIFHADIFLNDGDANFSPSGNTDFTPVKFGSVGFLDMEDDGDLDVIISGTQANDTSLTRLYVNDGSGNFSIDAGSVFEQLSANDVDIIDSDNDGDLDILMSGMNDISEVRTVLYVNNGSGQFTEIATNLQDTFAGTNAIADLDHDGDQDIVIIGSQAGGLPNIFNIVYENLGDNEFNPVATLGGEYIAACVINDFNGDGLRDIIIQGFVDDTNVYWNSSDILSSSDQQIAIDLSIFPNPTNDIVNIDSSEVIDSISIYTLLGKEVLKVLAGSDKVQLDISTFAASTYILNIRAKGASEIYKIIKL